LIEINKTKVINFEAAIRGMRNPKKSWENSDSKMIYYGSGCEFWDSIAEPLGDLAFKLGENDKELAMRLVKAGSDHRKFMRQIFISMDVIAPLYWFNQYDTYKVGTTANSTSKMHLITSRKLTKDDFSWDCMTTYRENQLEHLNDLIGKYNRLKSRIKELQRKLHPQNSKVVSYRINKLSNTKNEIWEEIIKDIPDSFIYLRTVSLNYEVLRNMYHSRKNHKLKEWHKFCDWIEELPYSELITVKG